MGQSPSTTNMKFLVLFACVAAASATNLVTYPNGAVAPALTPEVAAATAAHFAAKGAVPYAGYAGAYAGYAGYAGWAGYPYAPALVGHPNGAVVPAEPADVVAARAEHLAAHGAPVVAPAATVAPYYAPGFAGLVAHPNGALVPAEPADVVAARADHLAAHA